ncbi:MAG: hypothetical protein AAGJ82_15715, partial [Bacteroidota bacterium]
MKPFVLTFIFFLGSLAGASAQHPALEAAIVQSDHHAYAASNTALAAFIDAHPQRKYDLAQAWWVMS